MRKDTKAFALRYARCFQKKSNLKLEKLETTSVFVEYQQSSDHYSEKLTRIITAHDYTTYNEKYNDLNGLSSQREQRDTYQREMSKGALPF